jgi:hypothetical protein
MTAKPLHNRKLVLSGIALTKARIRRDDLRALESAGKEIEALVISADFLSDVPFSWVGISILYGLKNSDVPEYHRVSKKYGDLSVNMEIDTHEIMRAEFETLVKVFKIAVLKALIHIGKKYARPIDAFERELIRTVSQEAP